MYKILQLKQIIYCLIKFSKKTEEIHKILLWQTIYCLVKCFQRKTRNVILQNMIIWFSFMKHGTNIKNIDSRKLMTLYYNQVKIYHTKSR